MSIFSLGLFILICILFIKYKPVYKVALNNEDVGYVGDKQEFEEKIKNKIENKDEENLISATIKEKPRYELKLVDKSINTNEQEILAKIDEQAERTYVYYAITLDGENKTCVKSIEEAENVIAQIKEEYNADLELDIGVNEIYTNSNDEQTIKLASLDLAKQNLQENVDDKIEEIELEKKKKASTVNDIYLEVTPVSGVITSRYGARESIRDHAHGGLDIGAPAGTPIKATAGGTVTYAQYNSGGYGNLVVIDHGNGVKTYYGHCSKLYVSKGEKVIAGEVIGAVGSTGFSTGNHLHFEIRINDTRVNPQKYLYK